MALRDLKTNLKSLRYGKDTVGGGTSNEPYITTSIDTAPGNTGGPDFTLRANTLQHVGRDIKRMSKFLFSTKGAQFIAKQNLLSRTGVKTQASGFVNDGVYLPTSTIAQAGVNPFGTHLLKQGLDPTRNTSPNVGQNTNPLLNLLGVGQKAQNFINGAGGVPVYSQSVFQTETPENNRLVNLKENKISLLQPSSQQNALSKLFGNQTFSQILNSLNPFKNRINNITKTLFSNSNTQKFNISEFNTELLRYGGGPGSAMGVGQTVLKRYSTTATEGYSNKVETGYFNVLSSGRGIEGRYIGKDDTTKISDFRSQLTLNPSDPRQNIISKSLSYNRKNIELRVNLGNPGKRNKNVSSYTKGLGEPLDKINALPLYKARYPTSNPVKNDLVKFRIGIIDNKTPDQKTYIHFRAFIDSFSDNYSAQWNSEQYMGRGEKFYRYGGFDRNINLDWTVAAQSKEELMIQYKKLNYLASVLAPDYTSAGYMAGNLITLTLGGWCYEQPGFITSLNLSVPQESPWEIAIPDTDDGENILSDETVKEMPHMVKVTGFNFTPIHNFVPRVQQNKVINGEEIDPIPGVDGTEYGDERYIALSKGISRGDNNYDRAQKLETSIISRGVSLVSPLTVPITGTILTQGLNL
ncbi:hypothetical protein N9Z86_00055 [bacterium]|nr:hypothetical protein [bacterium]